MQLAAGLQALALVVVIRLHQVHVVVIPVFTFAVLIECVNSRTLSRSTLIGPSITISCTVPDYWPRNPGRTVTAHPRNQLREQVRNGMFCDSGHIVFPGDGFVACNPMYATVQEFEREVISEVIAIAYAARDRYPLNWARVHNRPHLDRWNHFLNLVKNQKNYTEAKAYAVSFSRRGWKPWVEIVNLLREWR